MELSRKKLTTASLLAILYIAEMHNVAMFAMDNMWQQTFFYGALVTFGLIILFMSEMPGTAMTGLFLLGFMDFFSASINKAGVAMIASAHVLRTNNFEESQRMLAINPSDSIHGFMTMSWENYIPATIVIGIGLMVNLLNKDRF